MTWKDGKKGGGYGGMAWGKKRVKVGKNVSKMEAQ